MSAILLALSFCSAESSIEIDKISELVKKADLIVEGTVENRILSDGHKIPGYVGQSKEMVMLGFGTIQESSLKITQVFKGTPKGKSSIKIFAYPDIPEDITELTVNKKYILFLKATPLENGYTILEFGRGQWRVFDYDGTPKVRAWFQPLSLRSSDDYQDYDEFLNSLKEKLASHK